VAAVEPESDPDDSLSSRVHAVVSNAMQTPMQMTAIVERVVRMVPPGSAKRLGCQ